MADIPFSTAASGAAPLMAAKPSTSKKAMKPRKTRQPAEHPKYRDMICTTIASLKERGGSSRQAILKYILGHFKVGSDVAKVNSRVKMALRAGIKSGNLKQAKGTGASGSFRLGEKPKGTAKSTGKPKSVAKKPNATKKAKAKPSGKKTTPKKAGAKKPKSAASKLKKSPKKTASKKPKAKSPKKLVKAAKKVKKTPTKKSSKPKMTKK